MLHFDSDYMETCQPKILERLSEINFQKQSGYGTDDFSASAKDKIRKACACPNAEIYFLTGGTQTNATVLDGLLQKYQGVIAAKTGHIAVHEAGAIEAGGHKVIELPGENGKLGAKTIDDYCSAFFTDGNRDHMVNPGVVYISQPTEYGTLYSLSELNEISKICKKHNQKLFVDGARLAYALGCPQNDVQLPDLAKLTDAFYIGGTKCGAMIGEAVVFPKPNTVPHFFTIIKQHGALLAKGWITGLQFDTLFSDNLYFELGKNGVNRAAELETIFKNKGYKIFIESPTNQKFIILDNEKLNELSKNCTFSFWEKYDENHTVVRFASSWATTVSQIQELETKI